ncbi:MAG TPA: ATP-binding protein [Pirellulales bacterium]|jgi:two-component system phosphate regulon sensor histidine kinase PhoR|nr:ATP-binding protein [Pirellulales bacterium]
MSPARFDTIVAVGGLVLASACTVAYLAGWGLGEESISSRAGLLAGSALLSAALLSLVLCRMNRNAQLAKRFLDTICEASDANHQVAARDALAALDAGSSWRPLLKRIERTLADRQSRLTDSETTRAAIEVRCRRALADQQRMSDIISSIPEPILVVDGYDDILLSNRSANELLGLDGMQAGRRALDQIERCQRLIALVGELRRYPSHMIRTESIELEDLRGTRRWYNVSVSALAAPRADDPTGVDPSGGVVVVFRDTTALRKVQKQHAEFVSSASHEMKAPLSGIKAYVELLADATDDATREEFVNVINGQAERLHRLVENLLNIARVEAGVVKVSKHAQPLNDILAEAVRVVQPSAELKQIAIAYEPSPLYLGVLVDRDLMLQAAINLLSNSIKYTRPSGKVTVSSRLVGDNVQFDVEDTGVGLSEEDCVKIFDKFYRVAKDKEMAPGTGLGLPLAKYLVEDVHGGRLSVTSKLGVGSRFTITLPMVARGSTLVAAAAHV